MLTARTLKRHLNREVLLRAAVAPAWIAAALFAGWRLLVGVGVPVAASLAFALAALAVALRYRRLAWTEAQALVALDRAADAGGLALALAEREGELWQKRLDDKLAHTRAPPLALARPLAALLCAAAFAVAASLVPRPKAFVLPIQEAALSHVQDASLKAEALKAEEPLDAALQAELERLKKDAESGRFDVADWAALDAVSEALDQSATQRAQELAAAEAAAQKLAEALDAKAGEEAAQRAKEELEAALLNLEKPGGAGEAGEAKQGGEGKPGEQAKNVKSGADAKSLAKALAERRAAMEKCSGCGAQASLQKGLKPAEDGAQAPQGYVHQHGESSGDSSGESGIAAPTSGPGAAPVTFGPQHPIDPDALEQQGLKKNGEGEPTELMGVRKAAPKPGEEGASGTVGAPAAGPDGLVPGAAPLAPRHRDLVKRYFQPKTGEKK